MNARRCWLLLLLALPLAGCGLKGDLVLPDPAAPVDAPQPAGAQAAPNDEPRPRE